MSKFLYDEVNHVFTSINDKLLISEDEYKNNYVPYLEDINRGNGFISISDGNVKYIPLKKYIKVNNEFGTWASVPDANNPENGYSYFELDAKQVNEHEALRGTNVISLYVDNGFKEFKLEEYESFDFRNKKVIPNMIFIRNKLLGNNFSIDTMVNNCINRGFKITVNGNEYYQPFNVVDDTVYFLSLLESDPEDRMMKLFMYRDLEDSSLHSYSILKGVLVTDSLIKYMLYLIRRYSFYIREVAKTFYDNMEKMNSKQEIQHFKENYINDIINFIKNNYIDKDNEKYDILKTAIITEKSSSTVKEEKPDSSKNNDKKDNKPEEKDSSKKEEDKSKPVSKPEDHKDDNKDKQGDDKPEDKKEDHKDDNKEKEEKKKSEK